MAYTPTDWVNDVTPVNEALMDKIETGIADAHDALPPDPTGLDEKWLTVEAGTIIWDDLPVSSTIDYESEWAAGTAYTPGDVVSYNGINYMAVNPSTGVTPTSVEQSPYVATNAVTVAATQLYQTKLLSSDTQPAFRVLGDGRHDWGPGGAVALDVNLYRAGAGVLKTDTSLSVNGSVYGGGGLPLESAAYWCYVSGEGQGRLLITNSGRHEWGPGNAARDTNLYRGGVDRLATDDQFVIIKASGSALAVFRTGDNYYRFEVTADGVLNWSPGGAAGSADVNLYRLQADVLKTDDNFQVGGATLALTGDNAYFQARSMTSASFAFLVSQVVGESFDRVQFLPGILRLGAGIAAPLPVLGVRRTGWSAMTGTKLRTTVVTDSVTLPELAKRVGALIDDLIVHGMIGA